MHGTRGIIVTAPTCCMRLAQGMVIAEVQGIKRQDMETKRSSAGLFLFAVLYQINVRAN
jgi:hypothetical protein